ncbi:MAG TPA: hypothetical protein VFV40_00430 [Nocardioides sp.]|nr:hypothetical protein [Nocardioides sp.]
MRHSTPLLGLVGTVAGLVAAAVGYDLMTSPLPPAGDEAVVAPIGRQVEAEPVEVRTRLAPCKPPARLQAGECVTHVWRTEVVEDPAPAPAQVAAPVRVAAPAGDDADDADENEGREVEDREDHEAEDREDREDHETEDHTEDHEAEDHEAESAVED